ncbi:MAG: glycosyl hydrolase [Planctomycetota bacterium]
MNLRIVTLLLLSLSLPFQFPAIGQAQDPSKSTGDQVLFDALKFRSIGPFRGGRSAATAGVPGNPMLYYMGAAGGGVWKTEDAGSSWSNISDGSFGGSIGAIAVAPSNPNIIYVGGGEVTVRGNVSHGYGMWKSVDAGKTWTSIGLNDSRRIPRIRIDPTNPDIVYAAVLGHLFGPNQERGVFKSVDGGKNWKRVLFASEEAGAVDLVIDPNNKDTLYATTWKVLRTPYSLESGGEGSGIWKSTDAGENWTNISTNKGLPKAPLGICGVAVSPVDSNRVWAMVEAKEGGLFRSDNGGETWQRINEERKLRQRAWYYTRVYAGPTDVNEVYVLNVRFWRSTDGGKSFGSISTPHGDHHDLWIAPDDPDRMAVADDGGVQVSFNRGKTWSTYENQPTAQFYRVTTDNHFPYRIYGAQQDNSTVRILSRTSGSRIGERDWEPTAGGESGFLAPDPNDPEIVYGGSYGGYLTRFNHRTKEVRNIHVWPDNPMGHGAGDGKYRFQWNFPIFFSRHNPKVLYTAGNVLFKTENGGASWTQISPDLTRNDPTKLGSSGGPITQDNTSVEYYCTIFAAAESIEKDVMWVGSDDGLIHITRDGGKKWDNVTPPELPEWSQINSIEAHPTEPGGLYVAATRYKLDDFKPYLFKTTDYGKTWQSINKGIDRKHFTRVIRADDEREGFLFAGTESGLYVSFDDGANWNSFQCNVPVVPVTDMAIKEGDLIVATQGRSFWVLDDLSMLRQWNPDVAKSSVHMFNTRPTYRMRGGGSSRVGRTSGQNVLSGVPIRFHLKEKPDSSVTTNIEIHSAEGELIQTFSTKPDKKLQQQSLNLKAGMNEIRWNMRYPSAETFEGMVLWGGGTGGPMAQPGTYKVRMTQTINVDQPESSEKADQPKKKKNKKTEAKSAKDADQTITVLAEDTFDVVADPRSSATPADFAKQLKFLLGVRDKLSEIHRCIKKIRDVREQLDALTVRLKKAGEYDELVKQANAISSKLTRIEERLYQTKNQSSQDPLNFPIRLNNRLSGLVGVVSSGDNAPTRQSIEVRDTLIAEIDPLLKEYQSVVDKELKSFNAAVGNAKVPAIFD